MRYKDLLTDFITAGDVLDMIKFAEMTDEFVSEVEEMHPEMAKRFIKKLKLYKNPFKDRETVECLVSCLKNEDGTNGGHWSYEETSKVAEKYGIENKNMFYYVLNMIYSDFYSSDYSTEKYIKDSIKFINDKDAPEDKVLRYYRAMNY